MVSLNIGVTMTSVVVEAIISLVAMRFGIPNSRLVALLVDLQRIPLVEFLHIKLLLLPLPSLLQFPFPFLLVNLMTVESVFRMRKMAWVQVFNGNSQKYKSFLILVS
jgi:hypothetical protein